MSATPEEWGNSDSTIGEGGGIWNDGQLTLTNCIIQNNGVNYYPLINSEPIANASWSAYGGGIYNAANASLNLNRVVVGNSVIEGGYDSGTLPVTHDGGGIYNAGTAGITNALITNNSMEDEFGAAESYSYGGGIYNDTTGNLTVSQSAITSNQASGRTERGGGVYSIGTATFTSDTVSSNEAVVANTNASSDGRGGGVAVEGGSLALNFCTVSQNESLSIAGAGFSGDSYGGGVYIGPNTPSVQFNSTIVAGNQSLSIQPPSYSQVPSYGPDVYGAATSNGYNLIGETDDSSGWTSSDLTGTSANPLNPDLGPLQNNGGPSIGYPSDSEGTPTYEVLARSPALEAGDPATAPATDQRGVARNQSAPNIGAYEATLAGFTVVPTDGDPNVYAGSPFSITVTAVDPYDKTVYIFSGTITFSSSDPKAQLPSPYTFTGADAGVATFTVTLNTVGQQSITVTYFDGHTEYEGEGWFTVN